MSKGKIAEYKKRRLVRVISLRNSAPLRSAEQELEDLVDKFIYSKIPKAASELAAMYEGCFEKEGYIRVTSTHKNKIKYSHCIHPNAPRLKSFGPYNDILDEIDNSPLAEEFQEMIDLRTYLQVKHNAIESDVRRAVNICGTYSSLQKNFPELHKALVEEVDESEIIPKQNSKGILELKDKISKLN